MTSLNLNSTEMINMHGTYDNRSMAMVVFLIIALLASSIGCAIFLLLHFGRLHLRPIR